MVTLLTDRACLSDAGHRSDRPNPEKILVLEFSQVFIVQNFFIKSTVLAIALTCHGCLVIPVPLPIPIPIDTNPSISPQEEEGATQQTIDKKYSKTCYADALTESEGRTITESSGSLELAADKLVAVGKHKEAIRKYNEAGAAALNEAIAGGTIEDIEDMEVYSILRGKDEVEDFRQKYRPLLQKLAESSFKIGGSYARIGEHEKAIDCFDVTLKTGILPPNDAIVYLNRGDTYERMGVKDKAKADFREAVNLFKKYKLATYQKQAENRLKNVTE